MDSVLSPRRSDVSRFDLSPFVFQVLRMVIVALALASHLYWLDGRPPHFDEGVNGWFTDQMQKSGYYRYDPTNYHGPLHFYVLFLFKCLFGRNLWALRLPTALIGVLTVDWVFRFGRFFDRRLCVAAALGLALSPAMLYYQRDAIHESWLVFFLVLGAWGLFGLWQEGRRSQLWALGLALAGMVLTKETYLIHLGCLALAVPILLLLEWLQPSRCTLLAPPAPLPVLEPGQKVPGSLWTDEIEETLWTPIGKTCAPQHWRLADAVAVAVVAVVLVLFFYSGNGLNWEGIQGLVTAYTPWGHKALTNGEGHDKPFFYWCKLFVRNEPLACLGVLACFRYVVPAIPTGGRAWQRWLGGGLALVSLAAWGLLIPGGWEPFEAGTDLAARLAEAQGSFLYWLGPLAGLAIGTALLALPAPGDWRVRLLVIVGPGTLVAYSLIHYKTPWCIISILWPFFFTAGALLAEMADFAGMKNEATTRPWLGGRSILPLAVWLLIVGGWKSWRLNFVQPTSVQEDYVYVQSFNDVWKVVNPMLALARHDPAAHELPGVLICDSTYPLPWLLGDFTHLGYYDGGKNTPPPPTTAGADFLLTVNAQVGRVEPLLTDTYYREPIELRSALEPLTLYLRASRFRPVMDPAREPEFVPAAPAAPADPTVPAPGAPAAPAASMAPDLLAVPETSPFDPKTMTPSTPP